MIPSDVASRLRLLTQDQPAPPQPAIPSKQLTDVLSNLVPGQRLLAEIKSLLPNGTYRAVISQREITLALPFSAQAGDSLELEVIDSDGRVSLAFVAKQTPAGEATKGDGAPTRLSSTGQMIGNLLGNIDAEGKRAKPAALNNNQPLFEKMPTSAAALLPVLKEALGKSGMFFEAHQARWVQGKIDTASLLEQPQGKLSPGVPPAPPQAPPAPSPEAAHKQLATANPGNPAPHTTPTGSPQATERQAAETREAAQPAPAAAEKIAASAPRAGPGNVPAELMPIVQQQLDALSTQSYLWQGQLLPGQPMEWEIIEEDKDGERSEDEEGKRWTTRLQLTLPNLGGVTATLRLRSASDLEILINADSAAQATLRAGSDSLRSQLHAAGLHLNQFDISDGEPG
mgnify:FL=1